jgi:fermentation-respiration switch protein FrsA (DUF1100 family)
MRKCLALICYLAVLLAASRWSCSTSGFLLTGPGLALLLDRYTFRLLPWWRPVPWAKELCVRAGYFLVGGAAFYLMRPGIVPLWEAGYRGAVVSLAAFLLEAFIALVTRRTSPAWANASTLPPAWCRCLWLRLILLGLFALVAPVLVTLHPLHTVPKRTPAAFGLAFEEVRFQTADGLELAGWVVPHPQARGNVIFCHGHGRNRGHVAGFLETLHDLGLNVLAFDFRGHGDSQGHTSTFGHREVLDLIAAEAYLRQRFPGKPLFLVGVSLGAAVSLQALPQLPSVRGVWSEGSFSHLGNVVQHQLAWLPTCFRHPLAELYDDLAWFDCGFRASDIEPIDALNQVRVPIYFCHGERDELVPLAEGKALYAGYAGPKRHWWAANASHYHIRQGSRDEYLKQLRRFVEEGFGNAPE